jgi:hypothetical protein
MLECIIRTKKTRLERNITQSVRITLITDRNCYFGKSNSITKEMMVAGNNGAKCVEQLKLESHL